MYCGTVACQALQQMQLIGVRRSRPSAGCLAYSIGQAPTCVRPRKVPCDWAGAVVSVAGCCTLQAMSMW
jgi:hypothetical protein